MPKMYILIGAPGSGKSTWAQTKRVLIASADTYFNKSGKYEFDASQLSEAHNACYRWAVDYTLNGVDFIVDNTNGSLLEIAPYVILGRAFGYEVIPLVFSGEYENIHNVSPELVRKKKEQIHRLLTIWPAYWPPYKKVEDYHEEV